MIQKEPKPGAPLIIDKISKFHYDRSTRCCIKLHVNPKQIKWHIKKRSHKMNIDIENMMIISYYNYANHINMNKTSYCP